MLSCRETAAECLFVSGIEVLQVVIEFQCVQWLWAPCRGVTRPAVDILFYRNVKAPCDLMMKQNHWRGNLLPVNKSLSELMQMWLGCKVWNTRQEVETPLLLSVFVSCPSVCRKSDESLRNASAAAWKCLSRVLRVSVSGLSGFLLHEVWFLDRWYEKITPSNICLINKHVNNVECFLFLFFHSAKLITETLF